MSDRITDRIQKLGYEGLYKRRVTAAEIKDIYSRLGKPMTRVEAARLRIDAAQAGVRLDWERIDLTDW